MSIKLKFTKFDLLLNPPANSVLFGIDESTGDVMIKNSRGELEKIQKVPTGGGAVGESVVIGSISGATTGIKYLANGLDVSPTGDYTQASGNKTIASGLYSHASGKWTIASGVASFSGGVGRTLGNEVIASNSGSCNFSRALTQPSDAAGIASAILGGTDNTITYTGENSVILGGSLNELYAPNGAIIGGTDNGVSALATNGIVIGGLNNDVTDTAINSVIIGCSYITASTPNSVYVPNVILTRHEEVLEEGAIYYSGDHFYARNGSGEVNLETPAGYNNTNWDTAYSWGNHASAGYVKYAVGTNGQLQYNNSSYFSGATFTYNSAAYGQYLQCNDFKIGYLSTNVIGLSSVTYGYLVALTSGNTFSYANGNFTVSSASTYLSSNVLFNTNTPVNFLLYNSGSVGYGKPTTIAQYGITDAYTKTYIDTLIYDSGNHYCSIASGSPVTSSLVSARQFGKVVVIQGYFVGNLSNTVQQNLLTIPSSISFPDDSGCRGFAQVQQYGANQVEGVTISINTSGVIIGTGDTIDDSSQTYNINISYITASSHS